MGEMAELRDQARRGGIRLPGRHSVKTGHRFVYTDPAYVMTEFFKPRNAIRVEGEIPRHSCVYVARFTHGGACIISSNNLFTATRDYGDSPMGARM